MFITRSWLSTTLRWAGIGAAALVALLSVPVTVSADSAPQAYRAGTSSPVANSQTAAVNCTVQSTGNGVNVRTKPTDDGGSVVIGQLQLGQRVTSPGCTIVAGDLEAACGGGADLDWWKVDFRGATGYVVVDCMQMVV
jgi:hypothetical protein